MSTRANTAKTFVFTDNLDTRLKRTCTFDKPCRWGIDDIMNSPRFLNIQKLFCIQKMCSKVKAERTALSGFVSSAAKFSRAELQSITLRAQIELSALG